MLDGRHLYTRIFNEKFENSYKFKYSEIYSVLELRTKYIRKVPAMLPLKSESDVFPCPISTFKFYAHNYSCTCVSHLHVT